MKVLIACEYSGTVRDAFIAKGHDAISCDLLATDSEGPHIIGNAIEQAYSGKYDLMIAHPPCTYLCNSGVRWLNIVNGEITNKERMQELLWGVRFFKDLLNAPVKKICVENPIPHKYASLPKYSQIIHPYQFGHSTSKATCLWLKGLPLLTATNTIRKDERTFDIHTASPGPDRWKLRSKTFKGMAEAMANQWG